MGAPLEKAALDELLVHSAWLRRLARSLVGESHAEDLVQETWMVALRRPPDPARPARPWLAGVARRLALMRARTEARRRRREGQYARAEDLPPTTEVLESLDYARRLAGEVLALEEPFRTVVLLRYYHGLSSAEIGRRLEVPAGTVRWRLRRGLAQMRTRMDRTWSDRRSWCVALAAVANEPPAGVSPAGASTGATLALLATVAGAVGVSLLGAFGARWDAAEPLAPLLEGAAALESDASPAPRLAAASPSERDLASAPRLELRLLDEAGRPLAGVRAVLETEGGLHGARTDEGGRLTLPALDANAHLYVKRRESFLARLPLAPGSGARDLTLPPARELAGWIRIDGRPPDEPLILSLGLQQPLFGDGDVPDEVLSEVRSARLARATTGSDGSFSFLGLAADWSGELSLPEGYALAKEPPPAFGAPRLFVPSPRTGLVIEVERAETASPTENPPGRRVAFVVRDEGGSPVAGALAVVLANDLGLASSCERADERGNVGVDVSRGVDSTLFVAAPGWAGAALPIPGSVSGAEEPRVVSLERAPGLRVVVRGIDTALAPGLRVEVGVGPEAGAVLGALGSELYRRAGLAGRFVDAAGGTLCVAFDERGELELHALPAGRELSLRLVDGLANVLEERAVGPLGRTELRHVELDLARPPAVLEGIVRDAGGLPLTGVRIELTAEGGEAIRLRTGREGRFRWPHAEAGPLRLELSKRGFARARLEELWPSSVAGEMELRLHPGRDVLVEGAPGASSVEARDARGGLWPARPDGTGRWVLQDLPRADMELSIAWPAGPASALKLPPEVTAVRAPAGPGER